MGHKAKTRFVATARNVVGELMSIRELTDGSLTIMVRAGETTTFGGPDLPTIEDHISVHRSPRSHGTTITHTAIAGPGFENKNVAFIHNTGSDFVWVFFVFRAADLTQPRYASSPRTKDRVINIGSYDPGTTTLLAALFIGGLDGDFTAPTKDLMNLHEARFSHFKIGVAHCFMNAPSLPSAWFTTVATSVATRFTGPDLVMQGRPSEGMSSENAMDSIKARLRILAKQYFDSLRDQLTDPEVLEFISSRVRFVTLEPMVKREQADGEGRGGLD